MLRSTNSFELLFQHTFNLILITEIVIGLLTILASLVHLKSWFKWGPIWTITGPDHNTGSHVYCLPEDAGDMNVWNNQAGSIFSSVSSSCRAVRSSSTWDNLTLIIYNAVFSHFKRSRTKIEWYSSDWLGWRWYNSCASWSYGVESDDESQGKRICIFLA